MALASGTRLGPYEVISSLGAGGMGEVYRARDTRLGRHVAVKVLPAAGSSDAITRERFEREARVISALSHPAICPLFDIGEQDGRSYLVMECLEGQTLASYLIGQPPPLDHCLRIAAQIADGLAHAHAAGVIHRDLKPGNVMVLTDGNIKILDFGLARRAAAPADATQANLTQTGMTSGTIAYMSPEQTVGARLDHRSDIFSLGVVFYEMLTRKRPFDGPTAFVVMQQVVSHDPLPVDAVADHVPSDVARLLERMMAKSADDRPSSASEIAAFFRNHPAAVPARGASAPCSPSAPTFTNVAPAHRRSRPRRAIWGIAAGVAVLAIGAGFWMVPLSWLPSRSASSMPAAAVVASPATPLEHTQQGLGLLRRFDRAGAVTKAVAAFEAAIELDQSYAPAWAGLARAYWRQQKETRDASQGARAIDAANQALALDPYLADAHVSLGLAQLVTGNIPAAKAAFDHALVIDPSNAGAHRGLGDIAEGDDRLTDALAHYQRALALDPSDWELPRLLGDIPYSGAQYAEALKWYRQASAAAPDSAVPFRLIGAASHMLGDYPSAASALQQSLAIQPSASAYTNLGTALFYQGLYRDSLNAFERAVEMAPSNPLLWGNAADAYRWVPGNARQARESYARAIQLLREQLKKDPKHVANRSRLALYLAKSGDPKAALAKVAQVLTPDVKEVNTLYRGAVTYELAGNRDRALQILQLALDRGYALTEVQMDPELERLRNDVRYHRLIARFDRATAPK